MFCNISFLPNIWCCMERNFSKIYPNIFTSNILHVRFFETEFFEISYSTNFYQILQIHYQNLFKFLMFVSLIEHCNGKSVRWYSWLLLLTSHETNHQVDLLWFEPSSSDFKIIEFFLQPYFIVNAWICWLASNSPQQQIMLLTFELVLMDEGTAGVWRFKSAQIDFIELHRFY